MKNIRASPWIAAIKTHNKQLENPAGMFDGLSDPAETELRWFLTALCGGIEDFT